ncbi:MAG: hypothetical protein IJO56_06360 [Oscillospiraceae bacterium]|nr:hypothetical protein [Oscillospiraceae bacterium]
MNQYIVLLFILAVTCLVGCIILLCFLVHAFDQIQELRQELRIFKLSTIFRG